MEAHKHERRAVSFVMMSSMIEGGFPIFINHAVRVLPVMFFAGICAYIGSAIHIALLIVRRNWRQHLSWKTWFYIGGVTVCNSVLALLFIFAGTRYTSGINTALLLQSEMLSSFLIFRVLAGEHISGRQIIGALGVLLGTLFVLYNGSLELNPGDLLIVLGTVFYPIGNMCAKRALQTASSSFVLAIRHLFGGIVFCTLAIVFEDITQQTFLLLYENIWLVLFYGVMVLVVSKLCWYEGLKSLPLPKAVSIILSYPVFSLIFASLFFGERPSAYQIIGMCITIAGLSVLVRRTSASILPPDLV
ncbi:MAG: DMT family transporter [Candidatus Peribacteraceae bacterium]|jgi:drug/metabolite transporter (DMT)-like permease|nr:hypothetical protein [bacterium]MDP6561550.1 DMT family transporter [Candidatus Peribacteraceae bacterium]|tara:strand:+ start:32816 stop:33724 length:909 start_codon:yes stop_codon:yes gene_type:complete